LLSDVLEPKLVAARLLHVPDVLQVDAVVLQAVLEGPEDVLMGREYLGQEAGPRDGFFGGTGGFPNPFMLFPPYPESGLLRPEESAFE
jgi:hypothetical protein